jgi:hypothetical protein
MAILARNWKLGRRMEYMEDCCINNDNQHVKIKKEKQLCDAKNYD